MKKEEMNISKYDFHDGYLIDLQHINDKMEFSMESAEISDEELEDDLILSDHNTIKGKLHLGKIKSIKINGKYISGNLVKTHDEGNIYSFKIEGNKLLLVISWINHFPNTYEETNFFRIEIEADKIYWENIQDLVNPFW